MTVFFQELLFTMNKIPKSCVKIISGDFNAVVGEGCTDQGMVGHYGLGVRNGADQRLVDFCALNHLVVANTLFQHPKRRRYTWVTPDGLHRSQHDYFLVESKWKQCITNCRTYPGADCGSDP